MRINGPYGWSIPCMDCVEGAARQMDSFVAEPDPHDTQSPAAKLKRSATCKRGHLRSIHGRQQTKGRDKGSWVCKECERVKYEKRKALEKYKCADCGKVVSIGAVQCARCRKKDKKAAQPTHCTVEGCRCKARRRGMCATHYWKTRGELKVEQRKARHREATERHRTKEANP